MKYLIALLLSVISVFAQAPKNTYVIGTDASNNIFAYWRDNDVGGDGVVVANDTTGREETVSFPDFRTLLFSGGSPGDYLRGDGTSATFPTTFAPASITQDSTHRFATDAEKATWNGKQAALGFTPYNATNPAGYVDQAGARSAISLTTTGSGAATYSGGVINVPPPAAQVQPDWNAVSGLGVVLNKPSIPAAQIQSDWSQASSGSADFIKNKPTVLSPTFGGTGNTGTVIRSITALTTTGNAFRPSTTRLVSASYSITIQANASGLLAGASSGYVLFEICATDSATVGDWVEVGRWTNGQIFTSILTLSSNQPIGSDISKWIPIGYYVRLRSVNVSGTPSYTYNSGQEVPF